MPSLSEIGDRAEASSLGKRPALAFPHLPDPRASSRCVAAHSVQFEILHPIHYILLFPLSSVAKCHIRASLVPWLLPACQPHEAFSPMAFSMTILTDESMPHAPRGHDTLHNVQPGAMYERVVGGVG